MEPTTEGDITYSKEELGARLRQSRLWCGASQKSLCAATGISRSSLGRYENGRAEPRVEDLVRLALALQASLDYLLFGECPPSEEEIAAMRLTWTLRRISGSEAANVVHLIDGILSQMQLPSSSLVN
ncbi:MAG TPA: helix-turn-helix transcriptional regulator [Thermoanaerobaculia bacterium]|nr:helix-turn-helix transcriptional regulator [Thermoanaerobaculia bacterium]